MSNQFCDFCEKDVPKACKGLEQQDECPNRVVLKNTSAVNLEGLVTTDAPLPPNSQPTVDTTDAPGKRGYNSDPNIDHPSHYNRGKIEVMTFCHDQGFGPNLKDAVKYICRAGHKDPEKWEEDLNKAIWYINDLIEKVNETGEFPYMETKKVPRSKNLSARNSANTN